MKRLFVTTYLVVIHALLGIALVETDFVPRAAAKLKLNVTHPPEEDSIIPRLREVHRQMDPAVPTGSTIFLGDSITMGLATASLAPRTVNYGIGWQRSDQLIKSMEIYKSIERAGRVVITIGTNDLLQGREANIQSRYKTILSNIPPRTRVVMNSVPPLGDVVFYGRKIEDTNVRKVVDSAKAICLADHRCRFVNTYQTLAPNGSPIPGVLLDDHIHLTSKGYEMWIAAMRPAFEEMPY